MVAARCAVAWMLGIALAGWVHPGVGASAAAVGAAVALPMLWRGHRVGRPLGVLLLFAALGGLRWCLAQPRPGPRQVAHYVGQSVQLRGNVVGEGNPQGAEWTFPLRVEALFLPGKGWVSVRGVVLVQASRFSEVAYGDRVCVEGELRLPGGAGRFSYREQLARQGIVAQVRLRGPLELLTGRGGFFFTRVLFDLRRWARGRLEGLLPEPPASLLVGILLGSRTSMPPDVQEAFSRSGTTHILAISGWNISIVAAFLAAAGRRCGGVRWSLLLVVAGIVLYTLLVGAGAAVLRAALMGILYVVARHLGRPGEGITALMVSAWAMTLWNPTILWDIGFQLSGCATLGMLLFVPVWAGLLRRWPDWFAESMAATAASQLLTWPVIAYYFRQFSLVMPLANLVACPILAPLMLLGTLTLLLGALPGLGFLLQGLTWLLASAMLEVVGWAGRLSWASVGMPVLGPLFLLGYYAAIGWWVRSAWRRETKQRGEIDS